MHLLGGLMMAEEERRDGGSLPCDPLLQQKLFRRLKTTKPRGLEEDAVASSPPSCSSPKEDAVILEEMVWSDLPEELIDRVLAWLPPICLFRLRTVCRKWNSVLSEPGFLNILSNLPSHGPCFLMSQRSGDTWQASVYSHPLAAWHSLPLASVIACKAHSLIASAGGILCFMGLHGRHDELFMCNPLSRQWRQLPEMHFRRQLGFVNIHVDHSRKCYWVVVAGASGSTHAQAIPTEVYDSRKKRWTLCHSTPVGTLHSLKSTFCNGKFYCLTLSPCGLVAFDLEQGSWESIPVRMPRSLLDAFLVAGEHGSLLLVGRVGLYSVHQSMRIWVLRKMMEWVEVVRMPHLMFKSLLKSSAESFQCFGEGSYVCFSAQKQQKWLMYDMSKKAWHWFSGCPRLSTSSHKGIKGFFYEPRLDASVY